MKCHGCSSQMVLDRQERESGACTQWHSCPLCGKVRLISQPEPLHDDEYQASSFLNEKLNKKLNQNASIGNNQQSLTSTGSQSRKGTPYFA